ncbi:transglycosylase SLT domain-containing protein [Bacillus sp. Au-Bac7]|uniref:transglycosylase SLT domain-containing protein n=1 Tax=Bacillus sp. Au-Bac7 TaxID=2906458 RepID=UPI002D7E8495|nr:transglycosylase SLT domain-containing protein [Bacillus sp. Au-Bac7]
MNSLKTIFARLTNNSAAIGALESVGINIKDINNNLKPTQDILDELGSKWKSFNSETQQELLNSIGGIYQQNRLGALLNNYDIAKEAADTAANSFGSSAQEQERYADSLAARLDVLSNKFTELAVSAGNAVITDSFIASTAILGDFLQSVTAVVDTVGLLPVVLGAAGFAVGLFSKTARGLAVALATTKIEMLGTTAASLGLEAGMSRAAIATTLFKTALRGLLISSGIGIALVGIGWALETVINKFSEAKQAQQEFEEIQNTTVESLTTNKQKTDELLKSYQELNEAKEKGTLTSDQEEEYLRVQQQLATLLPTMVDHYDSQNNAILKNGDALQQEIEYTKELVRQKKELQQLEAQGNIKSSIKSANKTLKEIGTQKDRIENDLGAIGGYLTDEDKKKIEIDITELKRKYAEQQMKIREEMQRTVDSYQTDITVDTSITAKVNEVISDLEVSDKSATELNDFSKNVAQAMINMQEAVENNDGASFDKAETKLNKLLGSFTDSEGKATRLSLSFDDVQNSVKGLSTDVESANAVFDENGDAIEGSADAVTELSERLKEAQGDFAALRDLAIERAAAGDTETAKNIAMVDSYKALADEIEPLNGLLDDLASGKTITADAAMNLISKEKSLASMISISSGVVSVNEKAVLDLKNSKISSYDSMIKSVKAESMATANAAISKLKGYKFEIDAIKNVAQAKAQLAKLEQDQEIANSGMGSWDTRDAINETTGAIQDFIDLSDSMDELSELASGGLNSIGSAALEAAEKTNDATESSIYITDKYKQSLEKLNLELAKIQAKKSDYAQHSKKYQDAIKQEIKLLEQQLKLNQKQTSELNKQIKSGNIQPTGKVTTNTKSASATSSGSYSGQYSSYINQASSKYGVDSSLIAAIIKQESSFNANAKSSAGAMGLMQLMPGTAKELGVNNAYDAYQNIMGGTKYISQLLDKYNGSVTKALWAYNAGMGNVNNIVNSSANEWKGAKSYANKVLTYFDEYGGAVQASTAKATKAIDGFSGTITSTYGTRTRNGKTETHKGIDIAGNKGDKIGATTAGTVTYAGWGKAGTGYGNYGNVVAVTAADGKTYLYAHLDSTKVKKGDKVGVNQTIGTMGNTGDSDGVHLHYEVRTGGYGTDIDPMSSVQDARSAFSGDAADRAAAIDNAKSEVLSMQQEALQIQDQIQELNMNLIESVQAGFDRVRDSYNDDLARIDLVQASLAETDKKWIDQQLKKESIVRKQLEQDKKAINYTKDQIKNNKALTDAQKALLEDDLLQRTQDMISLEQQLLEERTSMADSIIDSYKQAAEAIKDAQTQAIDDMIDEINKADDEAEYTKQLEEAQKNRQELLDEIAKRSLDDSYESQSKIADLQEQLDEQNESITDMQSDRAKEQRIDNLNEQKETIQSNYENLVNDERKFARMRSDIINGNTKQIQKDLDKYYTNVKSNTGLLGKAISNNLIDLINQANRYLNGKDYKPIKIASAKEGGITPGWGSSGKLMMLHENEMISTEHDTKNLLAAMEKSSKLTDVLKSLDIGKTLANASMNLLTNFKIPSMPTLNPVTSTVGDTYHNTIQVRIDASNTTRQQARDIGTELVNNLKLQGIKMK